MNVEHITYDKPVKIDDTWLSIEGLFRVFYEPGRFFRDLKDNPKILVPYVVFCTLILVSAFLVVKVQTLSELDLIQSKGIDMSAMPIDTLVVILYIQKSFVILSPLVVLSFAKFCLWVNDRQIPTRQLLSTIIYGEIVYAGGCFLTSILILATHNAYASLSLAPLLNNDVTSEGFQFLAKFDVFLIWEIIAVGIGFNNVLKYTDKTGYKLSVVSVGIPSMLVVLIL